MLRVDAEYATRSWRNRLKNLMIDEGFSQADLAPVFGVSRASVSHYLTGRSEPTIRQLAAVAQHLRVSLDYLISGDLWRNPVVPILAWREIKSHVNTGSGKVAGGRNDSVPCPVWSCSTRTYAINVQGDAMAGHGGYHHGDLIFVDPDKSACHGCDIVAELENGRLVLRRLSVHEDGSKYLNSLNRSFPLDTISFETVSQTYGVVVFSGRFRVAH